MLSLACFILIIKMGSSFTITNDTDHEVWLDISVNYKALLPAVGGILALFTAGMGLAAWGASAGIGGALLGGGALIITEGGIIMGTAASTIAGLSAGAWTMIEIVTVLSSAALSTTLGITKEEA